MVVAGRYRGRARECGSKHCIINEYTELVAEYFSLPPLKVLRKEEREKSDLALFFHRRLLLRRLRSVPRRNILRRYRRARAALLALGMAWPDERAAWEIRTGAARIGKMRAREMQPPFIARSIPSLAPSIP